MPSWLRIDPRRAAPTVLAGVLAALYVAVSPPSYDLAAHLFRAALFRAEGFAIWNNMWYSGHDIVGYSLLFPAVSATLTPQLAAALAATATAALFELLAHQHRGREAWLGALVFGAAMATDLFTGRLAFAFGLLPALAAVVALDRRRTGLACGLAALSALCSPVAALVAALAGAAYAGGAYIASRDWRRRGARASDALPGLAVAAAALTPIAALALAFPEGGREPFAFLTLLPLVLLAIGALWVLPHDSLVLRAGVALYALGTIVAFAIPNAVGSNAARIGTLLAAPLAALVFWPRRIALLAVLALPLLYLEWHDPVRDVVLSSGDPTAASGYYQPLLRFLERQPGPPFRTEIPFTSFHWEAYAVATRFPLARGWERQLDIKQNPIFYGGRLDAATYEEWLHRTAVRFVAVADAPLDYSARVEVALIDRGLPYLRLVFHTAHWRVYAVAQATPIVQGVATLSSLGPDWLALRVSRPGSALVHVNFTPYWALVQGTGCVAPAGAMTRVRFRAAGPARLAIRFSLSRIGAQSPRCT